MGETVYFLQAVILRPSQPGCRRRDPPNLSGPDMPSLALVITCRYRDGLLLSTLWKPLLIGRCNEARRETLEMLQFYPQPAMALARRGDGIQACGTSGQCQCKVNGTLLKGIFILLSKATSFYVSKL